MRTAMRILAAALFAVNGWAAGETAFLLNGNWKFALARDAGEQARLERFHEAGFDAAAFVPIPVPSNWAMQGFEEPMYAGLSKAGVGFYLHRFRAPEAAQGRRVLLHFGGVWASAEVWLNGRHLGRHDSGFTSFAFAVDGVLRPGEENTLAVEVRQITRDYLFDANDDWSLGGIYRDVWLEWMPAGRYIDRVDTWTTFDAQFRDADLHVRALVNDTRKEMGKAASYAVHAVLTDVGGATVGEVTLPAAGHRDTGREHLFTIPARAPRQWTAETPYLYRLKVELVENGRAVQVRESRVGFRQVSTAGGVLRVNGRAIKLRGACRHDEHPDVGIATRREHWLEDIRLMKAANINAIRSVHYPPAKGFLELCDEMGMWVFAEVPMGYGGDLNTDPSYAGAAMLRMYETIARDRNHASVIAWDVGNENPVTALHMAALRAIKGMDPTRPLLFPWHAEEWLPPDVGILAPHYPTAAMAEAFVARADRPVVATEFSHALGELGFGGHADRWRALTSSPAGAGGMIWMWQDQGLYRKAGAAAGGKRELILLPAGTDGIVRSDRTPQRDYWETKAVYSPAHAMVERLSIAAGQAQAAIPVRNDYDFTDFGGVTMEWKLLAGEKVVASGSGRQEAAPHTVLNLNVPLAAVPAFVAGEAYYVHVAFKDPQGAEISRHSVELVPEMPPVGDAVRAGGGPVRVTRGSKPSLSAGGVSYTFDPATGALTGAYSRGRQVLGAMRPVVWRPLNWIEKTNYQRRKLDADRFPDLQAAKVTVKSWTVAASAITAETEYVVDGKNAYSVAWTYTAREDGSLDVAYKVTPRVEAPWLPEVGVELQVPAGQDRLRWLGLGAYESFPNERAAALFGVWRETVAEAAAAGMKSDVRWAEATDGAGAGVRLEACRQLRVVEPGRVRVLSAVEGRPTKFVRAERPEDRLDTGAGAVFAGGFRVRVAGRP